jgi:hypothetical protein
VLSISELCLPGPLAPLEPDQLTVGVDWARDDHAVAVVDATGRPVERFVVAHSAAGLRELVTRISGHGAREVAIERPDGVVVEALLGAGLRVVVISPNQLKNLRSRYGQAGNKETGSTRLSWRTRCVPTGCGYGR